MATHRVITACALSLRQRIEASFGGMSPIQLLISLATRWEHSVSLYASARSSFCSGASLGDRDAAWGVHTDAIVDRTAITVVAFTVLTLRHPVVLLCHHSGRSVHHTY